MPAELRQICVFCGSKTGNTDRYRNHAEQLGRLLVETGHGLVYGGGSVGLMGVIADSVLAAGGQVIGVIPEALATKELLHTNVSDMRVVRSMHDRKATMAELADAFIAMPGGLGTFEELFEAVTWAQLGFHRKNIGLLNTDGFFDPLLSLIDHSIEQGFIKPEYRDLIVVNDEPGSLLESLEGHQLPEVRRWMGPELA